MLKVDRGLVDALRTEDQLTLDPSIANELPVTMKVIKPIRNKTPRLPIHPPVRTGLIIIRRAVRASKSFVPRFFSLVPFAALRNVRRPARRCPAKDERKGPR